MPKPIRNPMRRTRAAAEAFAEIGNVLRPRGPVTILDAQWEKAAGQCQLEDAQKEREGARVAREGQEPAQSIWRL